MPALVIKAFPEALHARLKQTAAAHRRSVTQETIYLLEKALSGDSAGPQRSAKESYWAQGKLLPEYEALLRSGALSGGTESSIIVSEERDAR